MNQNQEQGGLIEVFESFFVDLVFPMYHYIRQNIYMTYCFYLGISMILIHWLNKQIKRLTRKKKPELSKPTLEESSRTQENLNKLENEIQEIKCFLKEMVQSSMDTQLIQQIKEQTGSIASIQQNFQKFVTLQEEFQRSFLYTQTKMMAHMNKTLSQRTGSNNNHSMSSIQRGELSFYQKQDSPRSQADSHHAPDQSILSQANSINTHNRKLPKSKVKVISQEFIEEASKEQAEETLLYTPQSRPKVEPPVVQQNQRIYTQNDPLNVTSPKTGNAKQLSAPSLK